MSNVLVKRHSGSAAILFYGSCLRTGVSVDGIVDLYLIVDGYRQALGGLFPALLNQILPPNVYYLEVPFQGSTYRAKYAVVSRKAFASGIRLGFHPYFWARFAQPVRIAYSRDQTITEEMLHAFEVAIRRFIQETTAVMNAPFTPMDLWQVGFALTYASEIRSEGPDRARALFLADRDYYESVTAFVLGPPDSDTQPGAYRPRTGRIRHAWAGFVWTTRRILGKALSILRLMKGLLTFRGGIPYIFWKIERHSGVKAHVSLESSRFPHLAVCRALWRIWRQGGFR